MATRTRLFDLQLQGVCPVNGPRGWAQKSILERAPGPHLQLEPRREHLLAAGELGPLPAASLSLPRGHSAPPLPCVWGRRSWSPNAFSSSLPPSRTGTAPGKVLAHGTSTSAAQESWMDTPAQCDLPNKHASYKYTVTNYLRSSLTNSLFYCSAWQRRQSNSFERTNECGVDLATAFSLLVQVDVSTMLTFHQCDTNLEGWDGTF